MALIVFYPQLGKLAENLATLVPLVEEALRNGANFVVAPELATTGYSITADQVRGGLGISAPYPQLQRFRDLASSYRAYVALGFAEIAGPKLYNSVALFGPAGFHKVQRKRGVSVWNDRGDLPFESFATPFGRVATIICSDAYLMDWMRISALARADLVLSPANWWGTDGQEKVWQTRAQENGFWVMVANRWGTEVDRRYNPPYTYQMNDAPSTAIAPDGKIQLLYRANQEPQPRNTILYATARIPASRLAAAAPYTLAYRRASAYTAIADPYYRPDQGNRPTPGLPPAGTSRVMALAYRPEADPQRNLATIARLSGGAGPAVDVLVLPGLGVSSSLVDLDKPDWYDAFPWQQLQAMIDAAPVRLAVTTILARSRDCGDRPVLLIAQAGQRPRLQEQIHQTANAPGTGRPPATIDLPHARVGLISGLDLLFPEIATQLAKSGVDLVVISSTVGLPDSRQPNPVGWTVEDLLRTWKTRTDECFHVAGSDASGNGSLVQDGGCFALKELRLSPAQPVQVLDLDSTTERGKHLNAYRDFDLRSLLGGLD